MSDYIDENFDIDETDELWVQEKRVCHELNPNFNDIAMIDKKCEHLNDDLNKEGGEELQMLNQQMIPQQIVQQQII